MIPGPAGARWMNREAIRAMARSIYGTDKPRGAELRSWFHDGVMSDTQRRRLGRSDRPPCFQSEEQWLAWCILEAARPVTNSAGYCYDCTSRYQAAMLASKLCEQPLTIFKAVGQPPVQVGHRHRRRAPPR